MHLRHGNPGNRPWPLPMAVERGNHRGLAVGERRRVLLGEELSGRGGGGSWPLTWGWGQWRRAYHSWQYRLTWMPWPRKSKVHMSTFHTGPVRRSCIVKFSGPDVGGKVVTSAPDTCNLSSWLPSYLRAQGRVGTGRLRKILSPTPGTHGGLKHSSGFLSLRFPTAPPLQDTPVLTPDATSLPASKSPAPPRQLSHTAPCLPPGGMHAPLLSWVRGLSHQSGISRTLPSGCLPLRGHTEAQLTSKDKEEQQHDGVEESQDEAEDVLMDHC